MHLGFPWGRPAHDPSKVAAALLDCGLSVDSAPVGPTSEIERDLLSELLDFAQWSLQPCVKCGGWCHAKFLLVSQAAQMSQRGGRRGH